VNISYDWGTTQESYDIYETTDAGQTVYIAYSEYGYSAGPVSVSTQRAEDNSYPWYNADGVEIELSEEPLDGQSNSVTVDFQFSDNEGDQLHFGVRYFDTFVESDDLGFGWTDINW